MRFQARMETFTCRVIKLYPTAYLPKIVNPLDKALIELNVFELENFVL